MCPRSARPSPFDGYTLTVVDVDGKRISRVKVMAVKPDAGPESERRVDQLDQTAT